jgi:flagellar biosynthetic protein FliQ
MEMGEVLDISRLAINVGMMVSLPVLAMTLFVGILVSVFQAITQVQEMTLTFVPKLLGVAAIVVLLGSWMLTTMVQFTVTCFQRAAGAG